MPLSMKNWIKVSRTLSCALSKSLDDVFMRILDFVDWLVSYQYKRGGVFVLFFLFFPLFWS